jgi:hypothetical protein
MKKLRLSKNAYKDQRGVTLIMVAAVLAILSALATGFYTMMLMQTKSAVRYSDSVRADMVAKAGISYGLGHLHAQAFNKTEDAGAAWYQVDYMRGASKRISYPDSPLLHDGVDDDGDGVVDNLEEALKDTTKLRGYSSAMSDSAGVDSDRFALNITDASGRININAGDNLAVMLDNLCRVIGPPLVAAKLDALQPRRWSVEADPADIAVSKFANPSNVNDAPTNNDIYYTLTTEAGAPPIPPATGRPMRGPDGVAVYGDGYAIAGYRARNGNFRNPEDIKDALTYVERNGNNIPDNPLEQLEIEVKFAAIRDHITTNSWVDTNTVCTGKFEWVHIDTGAGRTIAIDRDKSWVIDDPIKDPMNLRGSLRGSYLSIMNGHGAGQLRRIRTNGIDWVEVETGFAVTPGPISSYMIIANEEALLMDVNGAAMGGTSYPDKPPAPGTVTFPQTKDDGTLVRNPKMDYSLHPLCIHRAPVNVNTATDKVLVALLLGINIQHGHPLALGTDTDVEELRPGHAGTEWKKDDAHKVQPFVLTPRGLKRIPAASGKPILNRSWGVGPDMVVPPPPEYNLKYLNNYDTLGGPNYVVGASPGSGLMTEAHELAYRIIMARQTDQILPARPFIDPLTGGPTNSAIGPKGLPNPPRGPFRTYDDLYCRVIKPFDDARFLNGGGHAAHISTMLMANFNSNTDILKFNPNIEWIDRWGRNFTEQEPLMIYTNNQAWGATTTTDVPQSDPIDNNSVPLYTAYFDGAASGWAGGNVPPPTSGQKNAGGNYIAGAYITRSFRYKSDEMIDKTDLNRSTTEFSFDSNGIFEIVSTGQVAKVGQVLAERKFTALIKVYDVWRESTQQQFVQGTISKAYGDRTDPRDISRISCTGQLARDASGLVERKGLVTLPEPLLPLKTRHFDEISGQYASTKPVPNRELVSAIPAPPSPAAGNPDPLDAFGRTRRNPYDPAANPIDVPEVLANRVLPARWDGQIVLATNTAPYDPNQSGDDDTFLASFDGDLDTATCLGNGREQAKWPYSTEPDGNGGYKYTAAYAKRPAPGFEPVSGSELRCVQGIGLLGVLFDRLIASDPGIPLVDGITPFNTAADMGQARWVYPFLGISTCLMPMKMFGVDGPERPSYWNNVTVRMGSLRTDGAYLSSPGVSGNTATLKYCYSPQASNRRNKLNLEPNAPNGTCITMWAKTTWSQDDMRTHEFFNPGNVALTNQCTAYFFQKTGQYKWCSQSQGGLGHCGNRRDMNDLECLMAYEDGSGWGSALHGGWGSTSVTLKANESPSYRVQPFRWSFLGYRAHYKTNVPVPDSPSAAFYSTGPRGHVTSYSPMDWQDPQAVVCEQFYIRPFIDTELFPEIESNWSAGNGSNGLRLRWGYKGWAPWSYTAGGGTCSVGFSRDIVGGPTSKAQPNPTQGGRYGEGQDAKWAWAEPFGKVAEDPDRPDFSPKTFGMNNLNYGNPKFDAAYSGSSTQIYWHYRNMPEDGTYAVIDELKISKKERILVDAGSSAAGWANDRVSREMQTSRYYMPPSPGTRQAPSAGGPPEFFSQTLIQSLKGFDKLKDTQNVAVVRVSWNVFTPRFMCEYTKPGAFQRTENLTNYNGPNPIDFKGPFDYVKYNDYNDTTSAYSVNRPAPWAYPVGKAHCGRGVEVELISVDAPSTQAALESAPKLDGKTFTDPSAVNSLGKPDAPIYCLASKLRYRVRFMYPVDPLVDPAGGSFINPALHYLLDTPVFDDISVTYMTAPRILAFRELVE